MRPCPERRVLIALCLASSLAPRWLPAAAVKVKEDHSARIERIEGGLLPPIRLAGGASQKMSLADRLEHYQVPGLGLAVVDQFQLAWTRSYGVARIGAATPVAPQTLFQAGSISKAVAALLTLKLVDDGRFGLDTPVNDVLTSWKLADQQTAGPEPVRIRHLLSHSAGLSSFTFSFSGPGEPVPSLLQALNGEPPATNPRVARVKPPGQEAEYSNPAFAVLEQLLVDATGRPFEALARQRLFEPLGMADSTFARTLPAPLFERAAFGHLSDGKAVEGKGLILPTAAVGGLWTTPADLARFLVAILRAHRGDPGAFLAKGPAREMVTRHIEDRGLGVSIEGDGARAYFSQGGGTVGFVSHVVANPETGQGAAVMVNGGRGSMSLIHELLRSIAVEYDWPGYLPTHELVRLGAEVFARHEGCYEFARPAGMRMRIHSEAGRYFRGRTEMFPVSETLFVIPELGHQIQFVPGPSGRSEAFLYGEPRGAQAKAVRNDSIRPQACRPGPQR